MISELQTHPKIFRGEWNCWYIISPVQFLYPFIVYDTCPDSTFYQSINLSSSDLDHFNAPEEGEGEGDDDQQHRDHGEQHCADVGALTTQSWNVKRVNHFLYHVKDCQGTQNYPFKLSLKVPYDFGLKLCRDWLLLV